MSNTELLPCWKCGGDGRLTRVGEKFINGQSVPATLILCHNCGNSAVAIMECAGEEILREMSAEENWNRRPDTAIINKLTLLEELKRVLGPPEDQLSPAGYRAFCRVLQLQSELQQEATNA